MIEQLTELLHKLEVLMEEYPELKEQLKEIRELILYRK